VLRITFTFLPELKNKIEKIELHIVLRSNQYLGTNDVRKMNTDLKYLKKDTFASVILEELSITMRS